MTLVYKKAPREEKMTKTPGGERKDNMPRCTWIIEVILMYVKTTPPYARRMKPKIVVSDGAVLTYLRRSTVSIRLVL